MGRLNAYWKTPVTDRDEQSEDREFFIHKGILSDEHATNVANQPEVVLVEDVTGRMVRSGDLSPDTVVYVRSLPGQVAPLAQAAERAGFRIEHAEHDPQAPTSIPGRQSPGWEQQQPKKQP